MPDYSTYQREDFLADESFTNFLLQKNAADIRFWKDWIRENPSRATEIREATLLFEAIRSSKKTVNLEAISKEYAQLQSSLREDTSLEEDQLIDLPHPSQTRRRPSFKRIVWKAAGAAAVVAIIVAAWVYTRSGDNTLPESSFHQLAFTSDTTRDLTLPDGTIVQLNNHSSLEISKSYNDQNREVVLNGSAFFKVHKDPARPFIVRSGGIHTTALGTEFYVHSLVPGQVSVSLLEGKVRVQGKTNYVELLPGQKALFHSGSPIIKDVFNKTQLLRFTKGEIQFDHADLREIKSVIEEYFNKEVIIEGKAPHLNFTGNFDSKKIETILEALQFTYNIQFSQKGQQLTISFN